MPKIVYEGGRGQRRMSVIEAVNRLNEMKDGLYVLATKVVYSGGAESHYQKLKRDYVELSKEQVKERLGDVELHPDQVLLYMPKELHDSITSEYLAQASADIKPERYHTEDSSLDSEMKTELIKIPSPKGAGKQLEGKD